MIENDSGLGALPIRSGDRSASSRVELISPGIGISNRTGFRTNLAAVEKKPVVSLTHTIVRNKTAIRELIPQIAELLKDTGQAEEITLLPDYFLENNALDCRPLVILLREGERLVSVLYGRERRVLGIRSGMVQFGDYYGEGGVIAKQPFKATAVAYGAMNLLRMPWFHTVRASFKVADESQMATINSAIDSRKVKARLLPETVQHVLPLKKTFDAFLTTLGSHTRRNMRVYRRRVEEKGWKFFPRLDLQQAGDAFKALAAHQGRHKSSERYLSCCQASLSALPGAVYAGIQSETGEWVSLSAGWLRNKQYFMLVQLNDARDSKASVSTIMRSYLIEDLIASGVDVVNFVGGCSELLRNFCMPQPCAHYLFEKRGALSTLRENLAPRFFGTSMVNRIVTGGIPAQPTVLDSESS